MAEIDDKYEFLMKSIYSIRSTLVDPNFEIVAQKKQAMMTDAFWDLTRETRSLNHPLSNIILHSREQLHEYFLDSYESLSDSKKSLLNNTMRMVVRQALGIILGIMRDPARIDAKFSDFLQQYINLVQFFGTIEDKSGELLQTIKDHEEGAYQIIYKIIYETYNGRFPLGIFSVNVESLLNIYPLPRDPVELSFIHFSPVISPNTAYVQDMDSTFLNGIIAVFRAKTLESFPVKVVTPDQEYIYSKYLTAFTRIREEAAKISERFNLPIEIVKERADNLLRESGAKQDAAKLAYKEHLLRLPISETRLAEFRDRIIRFFKKREISSGKGAFEYSIALSVPRILFVEAGGIDLLSDRLSEVFVDYYLYHLITEKLQIEKLKGIQSREQFFDILKKDTASEFLLFKPVEPDQYHRILNLLPNDLRTRTSGTNYMSRFVYNVGEKIVYYNVFELYGENLLLLPKTSYAAIEVDFDTASLKPVESQEPERDNIVLRFTAAVRISETKRTAYEI